MDRMSETFGDSLTIRGRSDTARTAAVTAPAENGSVPKAMPPSLTFGHEIFSSTPAIPGTESLETMASYSSTDVVLTLTRTGTSQVAQTGAFFAITASTPTF